MKRHLLVVFAIVLVLLTYSCSPPKSSELISGTATSEGNKSEPTPVYLQITAASLDFAVDQYGNTKSIRIDPNSSGLFPIFGDVWLHLRFSADVETSSIPAALGGSSIQPYPQGLRIKLGPHTQEVHIPSTLSSIYGRTLSQEYRLIFNYLSSTPAHQSLLSFYLREYPQLNLEVIGSFTVMVGESFVIKMNWPFEPTDIEARVREAFGQATITQEWLDETSLAITITEAKNDAYKLSVEGLQDKYGYWHSADYVERPYWIHVAPPMVVTEVSLDTVQSKSFRVPVSVTGATSSLESTGIRFYRQYHIPDEGIPYEINQRFHLDLSSGRLLGSPSNETSEAAWHAHRLLRAFIPDGVVTSHVGLTHSESMGAFIYYDGKINANYLSLVNLETRTAKIHKIESPLERAGSGAAPQVIVWSEDESHIAYVAADKNERSGVYIFDITNETEQRVVNGGDSPLALGRGAEMLIYWHADPGNNMPPGYYMRDSAGVHIRLKIDHRVSFVTWVDAERILVNRIADGTEPYCFVFNTRRNQVEFSAKGQAFDYNSASKTILFLERSK